MSRSRLAAPTQLRRRIGAALIVVLAALAASWPGGSAATASDAPTVTGVAITSDAGDDDTYALGETITITVTFSAAVDVTGAPQLRIDMDPADWGTKVVDYQDGSGTASLTFEHEVIEPNYSTRGIAVLANSLALNGGSIRSASSQADADLSHDGLAHDAGHRVNWQLAPPAATPAATPAPSVTGVAVTSDAGDDDTYAFGETITVTVTFNEVVDVTGTPQLKIDMDPADWGEKVVDYTSGSGTASLTFEHEVVQPNYSTRGIAVLENSLALNGGAIRSASSQADADLSHTGRDHDAGHKVDWQRAPSAPTVISTPTVVSGPTVAFVAVSSVAGGDSTYGLGETIRVTLSFREAVAVTGTPRLAIDMDPADWGRKWATYESGSGTSGLTFAHTVVQPNYSSQGIAVLANTLELNGGSIRSTASGANAVLSHSGLGHDANHKVNWGLPPAAPNQAPVVNTGAENYASFVREQNAPRGILVSKSFAGLFSDPDGDQLTYAVSITGGRAELVDDLVIGSWGRSDLLAAQGPGSLEASQRVFIEVDDEDDWDDLEPPLPARPVITVTLTATDPSGLSASVQGDFLIIWEPRAGCELAPPERVSALGVERAAVAFWQAPSDDDACEPIGYEVAARSLDGGAWTTVTAAPEARSSLLDDLTPGPIEYYVTTIYPQGPSERPSTLPQIVVPEACDIELTVEANIDSGISGTWTNVAGSPSGCVFGPEIEFQFKQSTWDHFRNYGRYPNSQQGSGQDSFIAYDLTPGVTYDFKIVAVDAAGRTNESNVASATVVYDADAVSTQISPRNVRVVPHNRGNAFVTWDDPITGPSAHTLTSFVLQWSGGGASMTKTVDAAGANLAEITGLTDGTAYRVLVVARWTAGTTTTDGSSIESAPFTARLEPIQNWFSHTTPRIVGTRLFARVEYNIPSGATVCNFTDDGTVDAFNCPQGTLVNTDVSGDISISATTTVDGGASVTSSDHDGDFGGAAPVVAYASGGNGTLFVRWEGYPASGHGGTGTHDAWLVERRMQNADESWPDWSSPGHVITDTTVRSHTFSGLTNGTWQVRVRARTANTEDHDDDPITPEQTVHRAGFTSEVRTVTLAAGNTAVPRKPTGGTIEPGVGSLIVEWERPTGGGSAVYAYQVRHRRGDYAYGDGGGSWTRSPALYPRDMWRDCEVAGVAGPDGEEPCVNPRRYEITNLIGGRDYDVAVRARNANGWGDWLGIGEFNLPNGFPPVLQSAAVNGATLTLTFDRSVDTGSRPSTSVFSVSVDGTTQIPTGVGISGSTVTLTLRTAVTSGQTVTVSYVRPAQSPLQHNRAQGPSFSNEPVTNNTP